MMNNNPKFNMKKVLPYICLTNDYNKDSQVIIVDHRSEVPFIDEETHRNLCQVIEFIRVNKKDVYYAKPNIISILIDNASKQYSQAQEKANEIFNNCKLSDDNNYDTLKESTSLVYEFISTKTNSIINAFLGIEAFCNISIPSDFSYSVKKKGHVELYNKYKLERFLSTSEKLSIICKIFNITDIKQNKIWKKYNVLKNLRDSLVHQKSSEKKSIIQKLLDSHSINHAEIAIDVISYIVYNEMIQTHKGNLDYKYRDIIETWPQLKETIYYTKRIPNIIPFKNKFINDYELYK